MDSILISVLFKYAHSTCTRFGCSFLVCALYVRISQLGVCMAQRAYSCTLKKGYARNVCALTNYDTLMCLTRVLTFNTVVLPRIPHPSATDQESNVCAKDACVQRSYPVICHPSNPRSEAQRSYPPIYIPSPFSNVTLNERQLHQPHPPIQYHPVRLPASARTCRYPVTSGSATDAVTVLWKNSGSHRTM